MRKNSIISTYARIEAHLKELAKREKLVELRVGINIKHGELPYHDRYILTMVEL